MAELTDIEYEMALERGKAAQDTGPRAASARYDPQADRLIVDLVSGCTFAFPPRLAEGLENATGQQLAEVEVISAGYGLHWETLDVDVTLPGLMAGIFGTRAWMARRAGQATSPAKTAAAREHGRKGGRPRRAVTL